MNKKKNKKFNILLSLEFLGPVHKNWNYRSQQQSLNKKPHFSHSIFPFPFCLSVSSSFPFPLPPSLFQILKTLSFSPTGSFFHLLNDQNLHLSPKTPSFLSLPSEVSLHCLHLSVSKRCRFLRLFFFLPFTRFSNNRNS